MMTRNSMKKSVEINWRLHIQRSGLIKWSVLFASASILLLVLAACGPESSSQQAEKSAGHTPGVSATEILLGSSSALGGHASFLGTQYTHGAMAWFNEVNAMGGVHGRKIRLISYDDAYDPPSTVANTEKLILEDEVFMLFNFVGTPTSVKIIDIVHENAVPAFGFFTGAEALRTPFRHYMFHVRASYYAEAEGAVSYFVDTLGHEKLAVVYQDDAFGKAVLTGVQLALYRRGMEIVAADTFVRGTMDVQRAVNTIKDSGAESVIMVGTYSPLAKFIRQCQEEEFSPYFHTVSFVGSAAFAGEILAQGINPSLYEQIIVTQVVPSPLSDELELVKNYRAMAGKYFPEDEPNYVALEGFINAQVLGKALQLTGAGLTRQAFINTVEKINKLDIGIGKPISFGPFDHNGLEEIYYSRLDQDGTFKVFMP
jgi:branched-chain amino acid transport system substrate-binding protein